MSEMYFTHITLQNSSSKSYGIKEDLEFSKRSYEGLKSAESTAERDKVGVVSRQGRHCVLLAGGDPVREGGHQQQIPPNILE